MTNGLPFADRGLAYGDGLFETLRLTSSAAPWRDRHCARMAAGAQRLGIPFDAQRFQSAIDELLAARQPGVGKLILTRGVGGRGYTPPAQVSPGWIVQRFPFSPRPRSVYLEGMTIGLCDVRLSHAPHLAGIKHLNRLDQVLAAQQVAGAGWDEGLMLDYRDRPLELTSMNLFARFADVLWTPALDGAGVAGIARDWCLAQAWPLSLAVSHDELTLSRLRDADEVFACNSVAGFVPVRKLGEWQWSPGDTCRTLQGMHDRLFDDA